MNISFIKVLILFIAFALVNCTEEAVSDVTPITLEKNLVDATLLYEVPLDDLKSMAKSFGRANIADHIKHGVAVYKIVYTTSYKNEPVDASGLLYLPKDLQFEAPLLSIQHGTTFRKDEIPSVSKSFTGIEYFAATGYITFMPDFLGYGESAEIFHPYYDQKYSALSVIDMIKAGKNFLRNNEVAFNDQLFLAGYSEGGYVTMAAAKELDMHPEHNIKPTAIAAGAGGYDLSEMLELIKENEKYTYPAYLAFVIMSYNITNDWNLPLEYFFQEKYAKILPGVMNGSKSGDQINAVLTNDLNKLFNPEFYDRIKNGTENNFQGALEKNSIGLDNWVPSAPIRLFHGTADNIVPYSNSQLVLENLMKNRPENVELIKIEGGTHGSAIEPMIKSLIPWFESLVIKRSL